MNNKLDWGSMSYSQQYDELYKDRSKPLDTKRPIAKPSKDAQAALKAEGGKQVMFSDVVAVPKRPFFAREWNKVDLIYTVFIGSMHILACFAPMTFSWNMVGLFLASYFVTGCLGITLSYHRQLSHRSFTTPKWLEYLLAYCGVMAVQGDPLEWVSSHRCGWRARMPCAWPLTAQHDVMRLPPAVAPTPTPATETASPPRIPIVCQSICPL